MDYKKSIIGRKKEQEILQACLESPRAEFVAVYGRRRIGKTYLVKQFFEGKFDFYMSGIYELPLKEQLSRFAAQLSLYAGKPVERPANWFAAFDALRDYLRTLDKDRLVVFIDELPWLDTPHSNFIRALEAFWNMWAADQPRLKIVVCGSSTTWMTNTLLGDKGGLHNRVTRRIRLRPFTLGETRDYLESQHIEWENIHILQCYMAMGGTPYYLSMLNPALSVQQNIDELFFGSEAELRSEYDFLFRSLFNDSAVYRRVVETLATRMQGMTRRQLVKELRISDNGNLTQVLENLCNCDFVRRYSAYGKTQRDKIYQLTDLYSLFYLRFVKNYHGENEHAWSEMKDQKRSTWYGYAFEQVCLHHINQIKVRLGISGIASDVCSWQYAPTDPSQKGAQIDLIIDRADGNINLCEMKYSLDQYDLTADYVERLKERRDLFRQVTGTHATLRLTMITTYGVKRGKYANNIQNEVILDDLFVEG